MEAEITKAFFRSEAEGVPPVELAVGGDPRTVILESIRHANRAVELGDRSGWLEITIKKGSLQYLGRVQFGWIMEPHEAINVKTVGEDLKEWVASLHLEEEEEEMPPRKKGESYIHMTVVDKNDSNIIGRVSACIIPVGDLYTISFAFCRSDDGFSRRRGRMISRQRMDEGERVKILRNDNVTRFEIIQNLITDFINAGFSYALSEDDMKKINLPPWCKPGPPRELGDDVLKILRAVANDAVTPTVTVAARDIVGGRRARNTKYVMHRDRN
jgi:hypothetical protein